MKPKNMLILDDEFIQYCKLNNIDDVVKFGKQVFDKGFTIIKYGEIPLSLKINDKKLNETIVEPTSPSKSVIESSTIKKEDKDLYGE